MLAGGTLLLRGWEKKKKRKQRKQTEQPVWFGGQTRECCMPDDKGRKGFWKQRTVK